MDPAESAIKKYRSPRRRPAHLRTKTGCLPCRKHKRKCDELKPICHNCSVSRKSICTWPPTKANDDKADAANSECTTVSEDEVDRSPGELIPWTMQQASNSPSPAVDDTPLVILEDVSPRLGFHGLGPYRTSSRRSSTDAVLFDFMRHVFIPQLIRPASHQPNFQSLMQDCIQLGLRQPFFLSALLACSGAEMRENEGVYRPLAELYYAAAVTGLRNFLVSDISKDTEVTALRTTIFLLIYERTRTHFSPDLETHLQGAAALLRALLVNDTLRISLNGQENIRRSLLESFVFHAATSIPFQAGVRQSRTIDEAFVLAQNCLETLTLDKTSLQRSSPVLGAPPELFRLVRQVGLLYQSSQWGRIDLVECYQLERELMTWESNSIEDISSSDSTEDCHSNNNEECSSIDREHEDVLLLGPRIYYLASRILIRELINTQRGKVEYSTDDLASEALRLVDRLQPSLDYFADYYSWPIFAIGVCTTDHAGRQCLMNKILAFWEATKNGTMQRLKDLLTDIWGWRR